MKTNEQFRQLNPKLKVALIVLAVAVVAGLLYFAVQPAKDSCEYYVNEDLADNYVNPALPQGKKSKVYPNWYNCNKPKKGDVVVYWLGIENPQRYVRVVRAVEGDEISVQPDYLNRGWNVLVDGEVVAIKEDPLYFGVAGNKPTMSLYMQADGKRVLGPTEMIVLANSSPGFFDSGLFGLFTVGSLKGRVELEPENERALNEILTTLDEDEMKEIVEKAGAAAEAAKKTIAETEALKKASDSAQQTGKKNPSQKPNPVKPKPSTKKKNQ